MNNESWKWDAEAAFKSVREEEEGPQNGEARALAERDAEAMKAPYTPPPNVAAWLKAQADKPKPHGRDIESLMRYHEAHKKPVGYWEDAPTGPKFGGGDAAVAGAASAGARHEPVGLASGKSPCAPSSDSDLYEPIGTMPIVGDECVKVSHIQIGVGEHIEADVGLRITITGPKRDSPFGEVFDHDRNMSGIYAECFRRGSWRILKRPTKPRDDVATGARAWADEGFAWVQFAGMMYGRVLGLRFVKCAFCRTSDLKPEWELHGPERDALIAECRKVMGL